MEFEFRERLRPINWEGKIEYIVEWKKIRRKSQANNKVADIKNKPHFPL